MDLTFSASELKRALAISRIIKSDDGDIHIKFSKGRLLFSSSDKTRRIISSVSPIENIENDDFSESDEFAIPLEKRSLFEVSCETITLSILNGSLDILAKESGSTKRASIKRRVSKNTKFSDVSFEEGSPIDTVKFGKMINYASCSAIPDDVNFVHFSSKNSIVFSQSRYHASSVSSEVPFDISILGSDVPIIKAFCSKSKSDKIFVLNSSNLIFSTSDSVLILGKMRSKHSEFNLFDLDGFSNVIKIDPELVSDSVSWSEVAIDGTDRLTFSVKENLLEFLHEKEILTSIPIKIERGSPFKSDFSSNVIGHILKYVDSKEVEFWFCHKQNQSLLYILHNENGLKVMHGLVQMRGRDGI
jgi:hypothetical protein